MSADARRALLGRLIDHAALFPPASLPMDDALEADRRARAGGEAWMLDRFICPASKLAALRERLDPATSPGLSVVLDGPLDGALGAAADATAAGLPVELVEVRVSGPAGVEDVERRVRGALGEGVRAFLEVPLGDDVRETVAAVGESGASAKVRCGGVTPDAFPGVEPVAAFVAACRDAGIAFKATAGLHHPIRHVEASTGFPMHGFLNLLAAAVLAHAEGLDAGAVAGLLAEEDAAAFAVTADGLAVHGRRADAAAIARAREELFVGYGSCSFSEPVEDLKALGIIG